MKTLKYLAISIILVMVLSLAGSSFDVSARPLLATSPSLGMAESFSVLAETTITNIPPSSLGGDAGLSPATGAGIGLTAAEVGGTIYAVDGFGPAGSVTDPARLTQAINAMMGAYTVLDQGCTTTYPGVQDLTIVSPLGPGVYCANAFIMSGGLTLSGASGVWIFKSAAGLTTSVGSAVNGGDPCNVWWRLVSDADLFSNTSMVGNILAGTSINMQKGASLQGRALAQAAVTLNNNSISIPICSAAPPPPPPVPTTSILPGVSSLPNTGGAPIQNDDFPWYLVIVSGFSAVALVLGIRAIRRTHLPKQ